MAKQFPAYAPIPIVVARNAEAAIAAFYDRPALAILPVHTDWNNFGLHFDATLLVMTSAKEAASLDICLMFEGKARTEHAIAELLGQRAWAPLAEVRLPYCSVLGSLSRYREIVGLLGFERAVTALRHLGDAAVLRFERTDPARVALLESETFSYGALRTESTYIAYRRGTKYLRPQPMIDVEDAATSFVVTAHLPSADNPYVVDFDFDPDTLSRNRITVPTTVRRGRASRPTLKLFAPTSKKYLATKFNRQPIRSPNCGLCGTKRACRSSGRTS